MTFSNSATLLLGLWLGFSFGLLFAGIFRQIRHTVDAAANEPKVSRRAAAAITEAAS